MWQEVESPHADAVFPESGPQPKCQRLRARRRDQTQVESVDVRLQRRMTRQSETRVRSGDWRVKNAGESCGKKSEACLTSTRVQVSKYGNLFISSTGTPCCSMAASGFHCLKAPNVLPSFRVLCLFLTHTDRRSQGAKQACDFMVVLVAYSLQTLQESTST